MSHTTILYYKYVDLKDVESIFRNQKVLCESLNLTGRIILANEGINGTLEGLTENIERYIVETTRIVEFQDISFKQGETQGKSFSKLSIKIRGEIVVTNLEYSDKLGPHRNLTGQYLPSSELNKWFKEGRSFYIIDMRNDYESSIGHFYDSILPKNLKHFRDLPNILPEIQHLKNKTVITVCTGGVRCEKASGFLIYHGFKNVYQLQDGIVTYMEKYPNQDFLGKLFVFDNRVVMGFNTKDSEHQVVGKCTKCNSQSENLVDHYNSDGVRVLGIVCSDCLEPERLKELKEAFNQ